MKHRKFGGRRRERALRDIYIYYEAVIGVFMRQKLLILGPGGAKGELKKRLETQGLGDRVVGMKR